MKFSNCTDYDYTDCQAKALNSQCNYTSSNSYSVGFKCPSSCNLCGSGIKQNCQFFEDICGSFGTCSEVSYFNQTSIQCSCNSGYLGASCTMRMFKTVKKTFLFIHNS